MDVAALILGPLAALIGVWVGAVLSARGQQRMWERERDQRELEAVRKACGDYVAATRRLTAYLKDPNTTVRTVDDHDARSVIPITAEPSFHLSLEEASAAVLLVVRDSATIERARELRAALNDLAVLRADHPGTHLPLGALGVIRQAEAAFVNAARAELGAQPLAVGLYRYG